MKRDRSETSRFILITDIIIMNGITLTLSQGQITMMLELLKPYTELSASIAAQSRIQLSGAAETPHAKKIEDTKETK